MEPVLVAERLLCNPAFA